jgi:hypothetical protein
MVATTRSALHITVRVIWLVTSTLLFRDNLYKFMLRMKDESGAFRYTSYRPKKWMKITSFSYIARPELMPATHFFFTIECMMVVKLMFGLPILLYR